MYIIRDALTGAISSHKDALAFKNTILRYWPRNGNIFSTVIVQTPGGVIQDKAHRKIYHVVGISIKNMEANPIDGDQVDFTYLYLKPYSAPNGVVSKSDIRAYIDGYSPMIYPAHKDKFNPDPIQAVATDMNPDPNKTGLNPYWDKDGWITVVLNYQPTVLSMVDNGITDQEIIQKVIDISYTDIFYDPMKESRLTALAMLDISTNSVFQTSTRVIARTTALKDIVLQAKNIGRSRGVTSQQVRYVDSAIIEFRFRRITNVSVGLPLSTNAETFLSAVETRCNSLAPVSAIKNNFGIRGASTSSLYTGASKGKEFVRNLNASVNQQLVTMANWVYPHTNTSFLSVDPAYINSYYPSSLETQIKVDGMIDLPPKEFRKMFLSLMKFDFKRHEKKGHWYDKIVTVFIVIVAIIIAVASFGGGTPISTALLSAAFALSMGALALAGWGMYLAKNGGGAGSISFTMGMSNALGIAAMAAGIGAIYTSVQKALLESQLRAAITEAVNQGSQEAIDSAATAYVAAIQSGAASSYGALATTLVDGAVASMNALQKIGIINGNEFTDIVGAVGGSYDAIANIGTTSATSTILESIESTISDGIKKFVSKPLSEILNQMVNFLQSGFNAYMRYVNPSNEGLADKKEELDKSEKELDATSVETVDTANRMISDPYGNIWETPDTATVCKIMTDGKLANMMNKYYFSYIA